MFSNIQAYWGKFVVWCRSNPKKTAAFCIIVIAVVSIWIHGPFYRTSDVMEGVPMILGDQGSGVNSIK